MHCVIFYIKLHKNLTYNRTYNKRHFCLLVKISRDQLLPLPPIRLCLRKQPLYFYIYLSLARQYTISVQRLYIIIHENNKNNLKLRRFVRFKNEYVRRHNILVR